MCRVLNILLALLSRVLFAVHGFVMVWYVVSVNEQQICWLLLTGVALLGVEMIITVKYTRNAEWKWYYIYYLTVEFTRATLRLELATIHNRLILHFISYSVKSACLSTRRL